MFARSHGIGVDLWRIDGWAAMAQDDVEALRETALKLDAEIDIEWSNLSAT